MSDEHKDTGTGWPAVRPADDSAERADSVQRVASPVERGEETTVERTVDGPPPTGTVLGRLRSPSVTIVVLLALLGFTLVTQIQSVSSDDGLSAARLEDLVRIQSDLEAREQRLRQEIAELEESLRQLNTGAQSRQAALEEATRRADELGILAGTLQAEGPGLSVRLTPGSARHHRVVLDAVQELRGAGAEAMQITDAGGKSVRIVASTYFLDGDGGLIVDGHRLTAPYTILAIGDPRTMHTALNIPGGVVESVQGDGGNVIVDERQVAYVTALATPTDLRYARPAS